jgi:hypothetical protein
MSRLSISHREAVRRKRKIGSGAIGNIPAESAPPSFPKPGGPNPPQPGPIGTLENQKVAFPQNALKGGRKGALAWFCRKFEYRGAQNPGRSGLKCGFQRMGCYGLDNPRPRPAVGQIVAHTFY